MNLVVEISLTSRRGGRRGCGVWRLVCGGVWCSCVQCGVKLQLSCAGNLGALLAGLWITRGGRVVGVRNKIVIYLF